MTSFSNFLKVTTMLSVIAVAGSQIMVTPVAFADEAVMLNKNKPATAPKAAPVTAPVMTSKASAPVAPKVASPSPGAPAPATPTSAPSASAASARPAARGPVVGVMNLAFASDGSIAAVSTSSSSAAAAQNESATLPNQKGKGKNPGGSPRKSGSPGSGVTALSDFEAQYALALVISGGGGGSGGDGKTCVMVFEQGDEPCYMGNDCKENIAKNPDGYGECAGKKTK